MLQNFFYLLHTPENDDFENLQTKLFKSSLLLPSSADLGRVRHTDRSEEIFLQKIKNLRSQVYEGVRKSFAALGVLEIIFLIDW